MEKKWRKKILVKSLNYNKRIWRIKKNIYNHSNINKKEIKLQKKFKKRIKGH